MKPEGWTLQEILRDEAERCYGCRERMLEAADEIDLLQRRVGAVERVVANMEATKTPGYSDRWTQNKIANEAFAETVKMLAAQLRDALK